MANLAIYKRIMEKVAEDIKTLTLDDITASKVTVQKHYRKRESVEPGLPGIIVYPFGVESVEAVTNASDDIGYPVVVAYLSANRDSGTQSQTENFDRNLDWRETIRKKFSGQRLAGIKTVHSCRVEPQAVIDIPEWARNLWRGAILFRFISREQRGV